jgi:hypothetical protein
MLRMHEAHELRDLCARRSGCDALQGTRPKSRRWSRMKNPTIDSFATRGIQREEVTLRGKLGSLLGRARVRRKSAARNPRQATEESEASQGRTQTAGRVRRREVCRRTGARMRPDHCDQKSDRLGCDCIRRSNESRASTGALCRLHRKRPGAAFVPIETHDGKPAIGVMREDAVTIGANTRGLTYRPQYVEWQLRIVIEFNPRLVSRDQLLALVDQAGWGVGICEGRPERTSALGWGRFERV